MWSEKYRPSSLDELCGQEEFKRFIKKQIEAENLPNLLLYGPPGTGKTSAAYCIANEFECDGNFIEINASDDRSVEKMRVLVNSVVKHAPFSDTKYKITLLDECDGLLKDTMELMRRQFEKALHTRTRFIMTCNDVTRIIKPLRERCMEFEFKALPREVIKKRLKEIAKNEKCKISDEKIEAIAMRSEGSLRKAINELQKLS